MYVGTIATDDCSSVTQSKTSDATMAAGIVASAASPTSTEKPALQLIGRSLLLLVRPANGGGWYRAADHSRDRDQRQDIRQGLEQQRRLPRVLRKRAGERTGKPEQQGGPHGSERLPHPEDQCGESDEAPADRHVLAERADEAEREVSAAGSRQNTGGGSA